MGSESQQKKVTEYIHKPSPLIAINFDRPPSRIWIWICKTKNGVTLILDLSKIEQLLPTGMS